MFLSKIKNLPLGGLLVLLLLGVLGYRATMFWWYNLYIALLTVLYFWYRYSRRRSRADLWWASSCLLFIGYLHFSELTAAKTFFRFYESLQNGMNQKAIKRQISRRFPKDGRFGQLQRTFSISGGTIVLGYNLDPAIEPTAQDVIKLELRDGRIEKKEWIAD